MAHLMTTLGPKGREELGAILPHEHIFVDLRTWDRPGYGEGEAEDVIRLMGPEVERARDAGATAIVEPSTVGVGRRADILRLFSEATGFPLVAPTGVYREPWLPPWVHEADEDDLRDWMIGELTGEIEQSGVQAGWIKVGASDDGLTESETKVLRAAGAASAATGAAVGSHTIRGRVARTQLDVLEAAGAAPDRFVWIHVHQEPDVAVHLELARRGAWIEYDGIGDPGDDDRFVELVPRMLDEELGNRLLLSHDRGWYDPAQPGGGTPRPFTVLFERFLPRLSAADVEAAKMPGRLTTIAPLPYCVVYICTLNCLSVCLGSEWEQYDEATIEYSGCSRRGQCVAERGVAGDSRPAGSGREDARACVGGGDGVGLRGSGVRDPDEEPGCVPAHREGGHAGRA